MPRPLPAGLPAVPQAATALRRNPPAAAAAVLTSLEDPETSEYLPLPDDESTAFVHSGWMPFRRRIHEALVRTKQPASRVERFGYCGRDTFVYRCETQTDRVALRGSCCRDRLCLSCGRLRSQRWSRAVDARLKDSPPVLFITLTLAHANESLAVKLDKLYAGFKTLRKLPMWSDKISGGVAFLEIKMSTRSGIWHPHLHILADGGYMDQGILSEAWRAITGDSFIVDIRRVNDRKHVVSYVSKYASKPIREANVPTDSSLDEAIVALKGRRLVLTFGKLFGEKLVCVEDEEDADELDIFTQWRCLGRLDALITSAAAGDATAIDVLACLERNRAARIRGPAPGNSAGPVGE